MTLQEIIDELRTALDDTDTPYLWSDAELVRYANRSIEILCEKAFLISDGSTVAVCQISLNKDNQSYAKHSKIISIREGILNGYTLPMEKKDLAWLANHYPTWRSSVGTPAYFAEEIETGKVTYVPKPDKDYVAKHLVYRYPLVDLSPSAMNGSPEIPNRFHKYIKKGVLWQAFEKDDTEAYDPARALAYYNQFMQECNKAFGENYQASYGAQTIGVHKGFV